MTLPETMKAVVLTGHGGLDKLEWREDVPVPQPKSGEVLIRVGASAVNNTDVNTRTGWYSKSVRGDTGSAATQGYGGTADADGAWSGALHFPRIQGADCCGEIVAVGEGVDRSRVGAEVTATSSARNTDLVASLGAARVIDYASEEALPHGAGYDVIFDTIGITSFLVAKPALAEAGRYLCPVLTLRRLPAILLSRLVGRKRALFAAAGLEKPQRLRTMLSEILTQIDQDRLAPVMDRIYPLTDLVEAHSYVETGHKRGNVVVV